MTKAELLSKAESDRAIKPARELLKDIVNIYYEKGYCFVSSAFAQKYGISQRTLFRYVKILVETGYLTKKSKGNFVEVNGIKSTEPTDKTVSYAQNATDKNDSLTDKNDSLTDKNDSLTDKNGTHKQKEQNKQNKLKEKPQKFGVRRNPFYEPKPDDF